MNARSASLKITNEIEDRTAKCIFLVKHWILFQVAISKGVPCRIFASNTKGRSTSEMLQAQTSVTAKVRKVIL
jgi:hypothetical protein